MSIRIFLCAAAIVLALLFGASANAAIPQSERDALIAFYNSTGGSGWKNNSGWNGAPGTECSWFGLTCDGTSSHVTSISLDGNNLTGTIPSLTGLTNLGVFDVSSNQLTGTIPSLTGLTNLQDFEVGSNQLAGTIPSLTGLGNLQSFRADFNQLTGTIPSLTGLTNLDYFDASINQLTGTIPSLTGLTKLQYFSVYQNQLTGMIPSLAGQTNLGHFRVYSNQLSGTIPSLTGLTNLASFDVDNNQLTGTIPSLTSLTNLVYCDVGRNQLTGTIPSLTGLTNMYVFAVNNNQLTGTIPSLTGLTKLQTFDVHFNQLIGTIPSLTGLTNLDWFEVSNNQLTGTIPSLTGLTNLYRFDVDSNQLTGTTPSLTSLANLGYFDVGLNRLTGTIPLLTDLTNLYHFDASANQLTGTIPALTGLTNLENFAVYSNQLTGTIPSLTGLMKLYLFEVYSNQLTGPIPSLTGLTNLGDFRVDSNQLSGTIPSLTGLAGLIFFEVGFNQLNGTIPSLTGLTYLELFAVESNQLTGTIPSLSGLSYLEVFQVGNNLLTGAIPVVPAPDRLGSGLSSLCPNALIFAPDISWDAATGLTPWYSTCASEESSNNTGSVTSIALSGDGTIKVFQSQQTVNAGTQDVYSVGPTGQPVLENVDSSGHQLIGTASLPAISPDGNVIAFLFTPGAAKQAKDAITSSMFAGPRGQPKHQVDSGMGGVPPNGSASSAPSLSSANGINQLVFCSSASNLVAGDSNNGRDIFLVDPLNPSLGAQRVSLDSSGSQLPGDSCEPKLSSDGNQVVFSLSAPSLYSTTARQIVIKDLRGAAKSLSFAVTGEMLPITTNATGQGAAADSSEPSVNQDGSVIAFTSQANLDGLGAPVGSREAFVSLKQSGGGRLIKRLRSGDGIVPDGASQHPQISNDGTTVVMQTAATNFLESKSLAKADAVPAKQCGAVAITTNFFSVTSLGGTLCTADGKTLNQSPSISGDGITTGFDSNAPQADGSTNRNTYSQGVGVYPVTSIANLSGDYSGQWLDPSQNGQGLVIDVTNPDGGNNRLMLLTWFVFANGQPTWVQGVGTPKAGTGSAANTVVVQMDQVAIYKGVSFPLGEAHATATLWGSITLTFSDANTGSMSWNTSYSGFTSGSMPIKHFLPVVLPASDAADAQIKACYSGNWFNPTQVGHGFEFEVVPTATGPWLSVDWFTYGPTGAPVWLFNAGPISGNTAQMPLGFKDGAGAQFPPNFNSTNVNTHTWGTAKFTFTDASHAHVAWTPNPSEPAAAGYGAVELDLQPLSMGLLDRRGCQ